MSAVPSAVKRQLKAAERLEKQIEANAPPGPGPGPAGVDPNLPPLDISSDPSLVPLDPNAAPAGLPAPAAAPATPIGSEHDWEHRFKQYKASTDATVAELRRQLTDLSTRPAQADPQVVNLQADLARANARVVELETDVAANTRSDLWAGAEDDHDPEAMVKLLRQAHTEIETLKANLARTDAHLAPVAAAQDESREQLERRFLTEIDADVRRNMHTSMMAINDDPAFTAWCAQQDEQATVVRGSPTSRQQIFDGLLDNLSPAIFEASKRTALHIYGSWTRQRAGRTDTQISPDLGADEGGGTGPTSDIHWGPQRVAAFYKDRGQGKYNGREAEAERLEKDLNRSRSEGRWHQNL